METTSQRLCIIPRWGGGPDSDHYPWLRRELTARGRFAEILSPEMPTPGEPTVTAWPARIAEVLGHDPDALARTVLLGHSVGCQAVLRFLATLPAGTHVAGALLLAAWFWVDNPWPSLVPWTETPLDLAAARAACPRFVAVISDNDPFTSDHAANQRALTERLGAEVRVIPGAKHFNAPEEPAVLHTLLDAFG